MLKLGAGLHEMREMDKGDVLSLRFRLLIIMMKACLDECPMGNFRKAAIIKNSQELEKGLPSLLPTGLWSAQVHDLESGPDGSHIFGERMKLLIVMAKAFAGGYPIGVFRRLAISKTLSAITQTMGIDGEVGTIRSVNVA
jgi:hypothetical protein